MRAKGKGEGERVGEEGRNSSKEWILIAGLHYFCSHALAFAQLSDNNGPMGWEWRISFIVISTVKI